VATFALNDCYVALNGTDRSSSIKSVTLTVDVAELDTTDFADSGWTVPIAGRKSGSLALTFNQDMAASAIDSVMWPLLGTVVTFEVRATNASVGASNPKFTGSLLVNGWAPISGAVSDLAEVSVTFPLSGAVTRATS
jgi:hypothetical protein